MARLKTKFLIARVTPEFFNKAIKKARDCKMNFSEWVRSIFEKELN